MHKFFLKEEDKQQFPVSSPEEQGIPSFAVSRFFERIREADIEVDSIQVVRNGHLVVSAVASPYRMDSFHRIYSAAKGIVATAMMFAIQEGRFAINDLVIPLLPAEWIPEDLDERWTRLTVYHLLTMTTGHDRDTMFEMWKRDRWIPTFFEVKPKYEPGTYFLYDMGAQYVMNEIIAFKTGQTVGEYLEERLFRKIGLEYENDFTKPEGHFFSSTMLLHPDGLTRLALFYLQKGKWNGEQLLREDLAVLAGEHHGPSSHYDPMRPDQQRRNFPGYALHMWRNKAGGFRFDGGQGQLGLVLPDENMAVGIMCCTGKAGEVMDIFFETIFAECYNHPIEADAFETAKAKYLQETFNLAPAGVTPTAEAADEVSGRVYVFEGEPFGRKSIAFSFGEDKVGMTLVTDKGEEKVECGLRGEWLEGDYGYFLSPKNPDDMPDSCHNLGYDLHRTMFTGGFSAKDTFVFYMRSESLMPSYKYSVTFFGDFIEVHMGADTVPATGRPAFGPQPDVILRGRAAE